MNQKVLHELNEIREAHGVYAEDLSDQLSSKYTSLGLMVFAMVVALKQYIFKPIQCWVPAEWPRPWEEYAENYCWIQNTYHVAFMEPGLPGLQARKDAEISYFQWVPILLAIQAGLVLAPHGLWRVLSAHSGCDPHGLVKLAIEMERAGSQKKRRRLTSYVSRQLSKTAAVATRLRAPANRRQRLTCSGLGLQCGCFLFISYIASKLAYLLCGLGHLYLMKTYLGFEEIHFGWTCASDLLHGRQWQQTRVFPRVTFCDVPIKHVGQWNTRSVQCVLPSNMLNEKIYIFLWFWTVFCMSLTVVYGLYWIASVAPLPQRLRFVASLLRIARPPGERREQLVEEETALANFLDGIFILQMVASRCGNLCAAQILEAMTGRAGDEPAPQESAADLGATLPRRGVDDGNVFDRSDANGSNGFVEHNSDV